MSDSRKAIGGSHQDFSLLPSSSSVRSSANCSRESPDGSTLGSASNTDLCFRRTETDNDTGPDCGSSIVYGSFERSFDEAIPCSRRIGYHQREEFSAPERLPRSLLEEVPLPSWVEQFLRQIIGARTSFSYFVIQSISTCRRGRDDSSATGLYPIPLPFVGIFGVGPQKMSQKRRQLGALKKLLHLVVVALNFEHFRKPFAVVHLLRRRPSALHLQVYDRLWAFVRSCGLPGRVSVSGCGRKKFQLDARFSELAGCLEAMGLDTTSQYHHGFHGVPVPVNNEEVEELRPYRNLVASRMKLTGRGNWHCEDFLSDLLFLPFVEPRVNRFNIVPPPKSFPDVSGGDESEVGKLCRVWDANNLLTLIPVHLGPGEHEPHLFTKVFANYKSSLVDRQIGDRRGANFVEGRLEGGPSQQLPTGAALLQIEAKRYEEVIVGAAADRKDFYHQFHMTYERASTNTLYPSFSLDYFKGTNAYGRYKEHFAGKSKRTSNREEIGDFVGRPKPLLVPDDDSQRVFACFASLFQGDHLGVEFACDAHGKLLEDAGCHDVCSKLSLKNPILHNKPATGLVIDDFFAVSAESRCLAEGSVYKGPNKASGALDVAKKTYGEEGIFGSDDKEVRDSLLFKVVGAEVNSSTATVDAGLISVGAPADKRLGLAMISAHVSGLPYTTDALHASLVGSWISALVYRRPMMAHLNEAFKVVEGGDLDTSQPVLRKLSRKCADEFLILACLAPVIASNVAVPFSTKVYASDASSLKGGFLEADVSPELARVLWRSADRKGRNVPLPSKTAALHANADERFEVVEDEDLPLPGDEQVLRPIGLRFDFVEICGGAGVVTHYLIGFGHCCGPVFDISCSQQYDMTKDRVIAWIIFMMEDGRLKSFLAAPPCTTFSPAAFPALRSYKMPLGFNRKHPRVLLGNKLAFSSMCLMLRARVLRVFGMLETTRRSKMRWTPQWKRLLLLGAEEVILASCEYGSPHQKEFAFMTVNMSAGSLHKKCSRSHQHVRIQGKFTKASATYCDGLARALARTFHNHLIALALYDEQHDLGRQGLEDIISNDLSTGLDWKNVHSWSWKGSSHINLLEVASALRVYEKEAKDGGDVRFCSLVDSHVALRALARGRSSSLALRHLLKRASCLSVAFGLYSAGRFTPTRFNPADCPTRDKELPPKLRLLVDGCSEEELMWLSGLCQMRRWISNWLRLSILLRPQWIAFFSSSESLRRYGPAFPCNLDFPMDFDQTLGFPGEGPCPTWLLFGRFWFWLFLGLSRWVVSSAAPWVTDASRRAARAGLELPEGRRVTQATSSVRGSLMAKFNLWLRDSGSSFDSVFLANPPDYDKVNAELVRYGRFLFAQGKPYYHFTETINAVSAKRPILRRSLQQAWDLAFMWNSYEPVEHHHAMPVQVLLALLSTCLLWGWRREAAIFALCWGAILRIGEVLNAVRSDLIFPQDVDFTIDHVLLRIKEPKTRFRAAKQQTGKLEQIDLIAVCWLGLGELNMWEALWPFSSATLRSRLDKVMTRLGLPTNPRKGIRPMTLASFRPGGAAYLIGATESAEMVRRRGRWISMKVMEIYLQEVQSATFMNEIDAESKQRVIFAMRAFPEVFATASAFACAKFPEQVWHYFFSRDPKAYSNVSVGKYGH